MENWAKDLALAANGATASSDSEYANEQGCTAKLIDGVMATPEDFSNRWHSSLDQRHPHWVEVHLAKSAKIGTIVIHFADPAGYPVSFAGSVRLNDRDSQVIKVKNNHKPQIYRAKIRPVMTDIFRLTVFTSANPNFPNAAQISEIEIYP